MIAIDLIRFRFIGILVISDRSLGRHRRRGNTAALAAYELHTAVLHVRVLVLHVWALIAQAPGPGIVLSAGRQRRKVLIGGFWCSVLLQESWRALISLPL